MLFLVRPCRLYLPSFIPVFPSRLGLASGLGIGCICATSCAYLALFARHRQRTGDNALGRHTQGFQGLSAWCRHTKAVDSHHGAV